VPTDTVPLTRVLVDIDPAAAEHPALAQAADLARRCGARITLVDVLPEVPPRARRFVTASVESELSAHRAEELAAAAATVSGVEITTRLLRGNPAMALIQEVIAGGYDLLVRAHARDLADPDRSYGAIDMTLLRQCPCPVWLVAPSARRRPARLLAAVHANPDDAEEQALNRAILAFATMLRDLEDGTLTVLQAWQVFGEELLASRMSADEMATLNAETEQEAREDLQSLLASAGIALSSARYELVRGVPQDVIPDYVAAHAIDLVVMGTLARTGVPGLIIGNTAERVLHRLKGSVLAVKPPGFRAPATS
jgi:nucleotide-binding universal stress UspA family protein